MTQTPSHAASQALAPADTPEGKATLAALWASKWAAARKSTRNSRIFGVVCFLATWPCLYILGPENPWAYILVFGWISMGDVARADSITESEYYAIPGSRNEAGKHQCIYCTAQDVEKHYGARSAVLKYVCCGSCQRLLYRPN